MTDTNNPIDKKAFRSLSYGLYVISAHDADITDGNATSGCVVNTFLQVTGDPAQVSVTINKDNYTTKLIQKSGRFAAMVLGETAPMELIGLFGFQSGANVDKFAQITHKTDAKQLPYLSEHMVSRFTLKVVNSLDVGSHIIFIGKVLESEVLSNTAPMTYAYYHQVKGGKTPPKASSFNADVMLGSQNLSTQTTNPQSTAQNSATKTAWRCTVCGYVAEPDVLGGPGGLDELKELPADFSCPVCAKGQEFFEKISL